VKVLIFGASGSAGGSVLSVSLAAADVHEVRAVTRRPLDIGHPKLRQVRHDDYQDYAAVEDVFAGVDACLYCLGKSARQVAGEPEYRRITYYFAMAAARTLRARSPAAVFHYVSGASAGLDSRFMWARVKAEAERDLMAQYDAVCWRPASIDGVPSASEPRAYKLFRPVARLLFKPFRSLYVTGDDIGRAMLVATRERIRHRIVPNAEIRDMAARARR
jgi:uncharacterized protein YbjT (DUF2867 family)